MTTAQVLRAAAGPSAHEYRNIYVAHDGRHYRVVVHRSGRVLGVFGRYDRPLVLEGRLANAVISSARAAYLPDASHGGDLT